MKSGCDHSCTFCVNPSRFPTYSIPPAMAKHSNVPARMVRRSSPLISKESIPSPLTSMILSRYAPICTAERLEMAAFSPGDSRTTLPAERINTRSPMHRASSAVPVKMTFWLPPFRSTVTTVSPRRHTSCPCCASSVNPCTPPIRTRSSPESVLFFRFPAASRY